MRAVDLDGSSVVEMGAGIIGSERGEAYVRAVYTASEQ
jgi:hypothetical protein